MSSIRIWRIPSNSTAGNTSKFAKSQVTVLPVTTDYESVVFQPVRTKFCRDRKPKIAMA